MTQDPQAYPVMTRLSRHGAARLSGQAAPALFLDRDGIVNVDTGYVGRIEDVTLLPPTAAAIRRANEARLPVVVVSNQSGVERGYFGWAAVTAVDDRIAALLAAEDAALDLVLYAGAGPDAGDRFRKPGAGMFELAARILPIDLRRSWMVGDKPSDLEAAAGAGLAGGFLYDPAGTATLDATSRKNAHSGFFAAAATSLDALFADVLNRLLAE